MDDLIGFAATAPRETLREGALLLGGFAAEAAEALLRSLAGVAALAPFRHMTTRRGYRMSVAMTNCGEVGWVSDRRGYRYQATDPETGEPWPAMPEPFRDLAVRAAAAAGFAGFRPDACLINRYQPGAKLAPHQDKDEGDLRAPVVSVSLGLPAVFAFGGDQRSDPCLRRRVAHGDVVVWGGPARLAYHGIDALAAGAHPSTGPYRFNLTFRRAR